MFPFRKSNIPASNAGKMAEQSQIYTASEIEQTLTEEKALKQIRAKNAA